MKKFAIAAVAAMVAAVSLSTVAEARNNNGGNEWRHQGHNNGGHNWQGRGWRHDGARSWRHEGWRNNGWRHNGWRYGYRGPGYWGGYWGGPTVVIAPGYADYCFIKKVRHHDRHGNAYVTRVRVCR